MSSVPDAVWIAETGLTVLFIALLVAARHNITLMRVEIRLLRQKLFRGLLQEAITPEPTRQPAGEVKPQTASIEKRVVSCDCTLWRLLRKCLTHA